MAKDKTDFTSTLNLWIKCIQHLSIGETCLKIARARNRLLQDGQDQHRGSHVCKNYTTVKYLVALTSLPPPDIAKMLGPPRKEDSNLSLV